MAHVPHQGMLWCALSLLLGIATAAHAAGAPNVRLYVDRRAAGGTVTVRLLGQGVGEFQALSVDLRAPQGAAAGDCAEASRQTSKTAVCSQPTPGIVRVGLFGATTDPLADGELMRVKLLLPPKLPRGRYAISAIVRLARSDGSEFEVGPISASIRVATTPEPTGR